MLIEAGLPLHVGGEVEQPFFHGAGLHPALPVNAGH